MNFRLSKDKYLGYFIKMNEMDLISLNAVIHFRWNCTGKLVFYSTAACPKICCLRLPLTSLLTELALAYKP